MITLVFADDHAITRAGIRAILNQAPDSRSLEKLAMVSKFKGWWKNIGANPVAGFENAWSAASGD
jgi:hypothetical protein